MVLEKSEDKERLKKFSVLQALLCLILLFSMIPAGWAADMKKPIPERIDAIIIGDRVVDIAYNLGVLPVAMSVRGSFWPLARELKTASQMIGCPSCVTVKSKDAVPDALKRYGVHRVIVEKSNPYCLYKPKVTPENIVPVLEGIDVQIDFVDFTKGLDSAIRQVGVLVGREKQAEQLVERHAKQLAKVEKKIPASPLNKKVVVINCILQKTTGKSFFRVEMPGGYTDKFLLEPLGCKNIGDVLVSGRKVDKGHVTIRSLAGLSELKPDVIVIIGDSAPMQKKLHEELMETPEFGMIPALQNHAVYSLPRYIDSSVIEYPQIVSQWIRVLSEKRSK